MSITINCSRQTEQLNEFAATSKKKKKSLKCILPLGADKESQALCRIKGYFPLICSLDLKIRQQSEAIRS